MLPRSGWLACVQIKKAGDKDIDDIKTLMEEVDMRIAETKKDTYEFKRDIIIGAENPRSGKIVAEKMTRCAPTGQARPQRAACPGQATACSMQRARPPCLRAMARSVCVHAAAWPAA